MSDAKRSIQYAAVAGLGFSIAEGVSVWMNPAPMDPVPTAGLMIASILGTTLLLSAAALVLCAISQRHAGMLAMVMWAAIWGPHTAEQAGWHRVGWAPAIVLGAMGPYAPAGVAALTIASGAAAPALRDGGSAQGVLAAQRAAPDLLTQPDLLLVTIEGISSTDRMMDEGQWGTKSPFSPTKGWTHFSTAIAPAPSTLPSMHSVLTSLTVRDHGGGLSTGAGTSGRMTGAMSLPLALQQGGYETTALVANPQLSPEHGFAAGFDHWMPTSSVREPLVLMGQLNRLATWWDGSDSELSQDRDQRMTSQAQMVMDTPVARPRFVWVHLASADPISARAQVLRLANTHPGWVVAVTSLHATDPALTAAQAPQRVYTDQALKVPLAIRRPGVEGGVESSPVAVSDLAHTMLAYAGMANPFPGRNLHNPHRRRVIVGGARGVAQGSAARTKDGHYLPVEGGVLGRTVRLADSSREALRAAGYSR
jgi:hypothetical protein